MLSWIVEDLEIKTYFFLTLNGIMIVLEKIRKFFKFVKIGLVMVDDRLSFALPCILLINLFWLWGKLTLKQSNLGKCHFLSVDYIFA